MAVAGLSGADFVSLISLIATVVGFTVAILQLKRTANASEATRDAVQRTEQRMALNHLLVLIPQFSILENELDVAAQENDRKLAMRTLQSWSRLASEAAALLRHQAGLDGSVVQDLETSARSASTAKADLIDKPNVATKSITRDLRGELANLSTGFGALVGQFRIEGGRSSPEALG